MALFPAEINLLSSKYTAKKANLNFGLESIDKLSSLVKDGDAAKDVNKEEYQEEEEEFIDLDELDELEEENDYAVDYYDDENDMLGDDND